MVAAQSEEAGDAEEHPGGDGDGVLGSKPGADGDGVPGSEDNRLTSHPCHQAEPPAFIPAFIHGSSRMRKPRAIISV